MIRQYDIVGLIETWLHENDECDDLLNGYSVYSLSGTRKSTRGRCSGGIKVFIRNQIAKYFKRISSDFSHGIVFDVDKLLFGVNVIFIVIYLPPEGSTVYDCDETNGVNLLEDEITILQSKFPNHEIIISGDFNARTKNENDFISNDSTTYLPLNSNYVMSSFNAPRESKDLHGDVNNHGYSLLQFCQTHDIHIVNGRVNGDEGGEITCYTANGCSLVDYTIATPCLFTLFNKFEILNQDDYTHLPQAFTLEMCSLPGNATTDPTDRSRDKYKWSETSMDKLLSDHVSNLISDFHSYINNSDIVNAAHVLTNTLQYVCSKVKPRKTSSNSKQVKSPWFDDELNELRKVKFKWLKMSRLEHSQNTLEQYRKIRNKYKILVKQKKTQHRLNIRLKLESCISSSDFWREIHSLRASKQCMNNITSDTWKDYFSTLLNQQSCLDETFKARVQEHLSWHDANCQECINGKVDTELNCDITLSDVDNVISDLACNKAPGLDSISNECIKSSRILIAPLLCQLFNKILETGIYPDAWCDALIVPIYKNGNHDDPENYRGIALLSCISKIFTKILNNKLTKWACSNGKMYEEQCGFTKGKSTIDQIFVLQSLINKYISKQKGRFYSVFIDFSKAFDSIPHLHMFYRMVNEGMHGRVITVLRNMYSKLKCCVQSSPFNVSDSFECSVGTRQGCLLSPFLFIFYLNELVNMSKEYSCKGIYVDENYKDVNMLLYADDLVLVGDQIRNVQKLLNILSNYCKKWGLKVNMLKTKMIVYRNGGIIKSNEKCYLDGVKIDIVKHYKYLGVLFSSRLAWSPAQSLLASQALKAMFIIDKLNYVYEFPFNASQNMFQKCIIPVLTYGSEVWGIHAHQSIENVLLKYCKKQLGVGSNTPSDAVLGECGSFPLYIKCYSNAVKFWLKIISLENHTLVKACYEMLLRLITLGRKNWASDIKDLLYRHGFGYVWEQQYVANISVFLSCFKLRLQDNFIQLWNARRSEISKLCLYNLYKFSFEPELYLSLNVPRRLRRYIAKFRTGNINLEIEVGRRFGQPREDRICRLCGERNILKVEDEFHMLAECPIYSDIRNIYIGYVEPNLFSFCSILNTEDINSLINLGSFVYAALNIRERSLKSL